MNPHFSEVTLPCFNYDELLFVFHITECRTSLLLPAEDILKFCAECKAVGTRCSSHLNRGCMCVCECNQNCLRMKPEQRVKVHSSLNLKQLGDKIKETWL